MWATPNTFSPSLAWGPAPGGAIKDAYEKELVS